MQSHFSHFDLRIYTYLSTQTLPIWTPKTRSLRFQAKTPDSNDFYTKITIKAKLVLGALIGSCFSQLPIAELMDLYISEHPVELATDQPTDYRFYRLPYSQEIRHYFSNQYQLEAFVSLASINDLNVWLWHIEAGMSLDLTIKQSDPEPEAIFAFSPIRLKDTNDSLVFIDAFMPVIRFDPTGVTTFRLRRHQTYDLLICSCSKTVLDAFSTADRSVWRFSESATKNVDCVLGPFQSIEFNPGLIWLLIDMFSIQFCPDVQKLHLTQVFTIFNILCIEACLARDHLSRHQQVLYERWTQAVLALSEKPYLHLNRISEDLQTNEYSIRAGFRKYFHTNLSSYRRDIKLKKSLQLLLFSQQKVTDIAVHAGYANLSNFDAAFVHKFRMTANKFRLALHGLGLDEALLSNPLGLNNKEDDNW